VSRVRAELYQDMVAVEDHHWWYAGLWALVSAAIADHVPPGRAIRILDAGCGTGGTLARLARWRAELSVAAVDSSVLALDLAARRKAGGALACASVEALPFADATFHVVTCLDVVYTEGVDDRGALAELHRVLRPGGLCVVNVPAYDWLRGAHDVACATRHRYTARELRSLLGAAGFSIECVSYWNAALFPAMLAWRLISRGGERSDLRETPSLVNTLLGALLRVEAAIARGPGLPFGSSVFAVGVRP
jgi:SAM-dependent methyltransferase